MFKIYQNEWNLQILEDLVAVFITLSSKQNNEKKPSTTQIGGMVLGMESFHKDIMPVVDSLNGLLRSFDFIFDLLIGSEADSQKALEQKIARLKKQAQPKSDENN